MGQEYPFHTEILGSPALNKNKTVLIATGGGWEFSGSSKGWEWGVWEGGKHDDLSL